MELVRLVTLSGEQRERTYTEETCCSMTMSMKMIDPAPRRSLAARRRTTKLLTFDDNGKIEDEKENSFNESLTGRRQSRMFNNSFNMDGGVDEPAQTPTQLVALYQKTAELAAHGKINMKNAFSITLVERLPQVLNVIALDDIENHHLGPNFVKAGSVIDTSAKIYGFRVDALYTETQKLSGNVMNMEEEDGANGTGQTEGQNDGDQENGDGDQPEAKKATRRVKAKATSFVVTDLSKITLEHEFEFRPLQPPHMCRWRGGLGADSIYAEMVSNTMYSSSDFPLIDGFTNANSRPDEQQVRIDAVLDIAVATMIDLTPLRDVIKSNEGHDHVLGNQALRDFVFNETPSGSFIDTIHESCLNQVDESIDGNNQSYSGGQNIEHDNEDIGGYNHDELVDAAMDDLVHDTDDYSSSNEIFKNALNELSNQDPSTVHTHLGNFHASDSQSTHLLPSTDDLLSMSIMSNISFADQMPNLLRQKDGQSDYSYFDATKLKLFAGPNIWKYTNLLDVAIPNASTTTSTIQQQQAPATRTRINSGTGVISTGPKRSVRVDFLSQTAFQTLLDQIMSGGNTGRDKKVTGTSQSALQLRIREKSLNQMQLARKMRPLTDLTNAHNFPELNFEHLHLSNKRKEARQLQQQYHNDNFGGGGDIFDDEDHVLHLAEHHDDENEPLSALNYDFVRPVHYEKIEFAKGSSTVNAKILKRQMVEEFNRQTEQQRSFLLDSSTASQQSVSQRQNPLVEFSSVCENLSNQGHLSLSCDLASAFYCMLINCNENKLYMKSNSKRDDILIQERPFVDQRDHSTLSYSYTSSSNLSTISLNIP